MTDSIDIITRLAATIETRKGGDPEQSYVAKLFDRGPDYAARKLGEVARGAEGDASFYAAFISHAARHLTRASFSFSSLRVYPPLFFSSLLLTLPS